MRKLTLFFLAMICATCFAQQVSTSYKVVPILSEQNFYLNSWSRIGGTTRTTYKIDLPENTIEWYYVFSTSRNANGGNGLKLVEKLTNLVVGDPTGFSGKVLTSLFTPTGVSVCNIYLMSDKSVNAFEKKDDNWGGSFNYYRSGSRENFKNGVVQIKDLKSGTFYLGFQNPAGEGMNVSFEVAAVVEQQKVDYTVWTIETKNEIYQTFYKALIDEKMEEDEAKMLSKCVVDKIVKQKNPADYNNLTESDREAFVTEISNKCVAELDGTVSENYDKAVMYGNLGWKSYENGNVDKCIEYSQQALTIDNSLGFVKANLGLCYMIKGDEKKATDFYIESITTFKKSKFKSMIKENIEGAIQDIDDAVKKYPSIAGFKDVKGLLETELNN